MVGVCPPPLSGSGIQWAKFLCKTLSPILCTLRALELQYPGWDEGNEYTAALHPTVPPPHSLLSDFSGSMGKLGAVEARQLLQGRCH